MVVASAERLVASATLKFMLSLGVLISLLYYSLLRQQQLAVYEIAALTLVTLIALAFDYLKLGRFLTEFKGQSAHRPHHEAIQAALAETLKSPFLLTLVETKLLTLYYAFFAKFECYKVTSKNRVFGYNKSSNAYDVFLLAALSQLPFLPFIHVLLEYKKGPGVAWTITFLTIWSVIWYLAQVEATRFRPIELSNRHLHYRFGLFWTARIPLTHIKKASRIDVRKHLDRRDLFKSPFGSARNVLLEFEVPVRFAGPYFIRKYKRRAAISLDNPSAFLRQLALRGVDAP